MSISDHPFVIQPHRDNASLIVIDLNLRLALRVLNTQVFAHDDFATT